MILFFAHHGNNLQATSLDIEIYYGFSTYFIYGSYSWMAVLSGAVYLLESRSLCYLIRKRWFLILYGFGYVSLLKSLSKMRHVTIQALVPIYSTLATLCVKIWLRSVEPFLSYSMYTQTKNPIQPKTILCGKYFRTVIKHKTGHIIMIVSHGA